MRNVKPAEFEAIPRPVVVICNNFEAGHVIPPHCHRRSQLVYGAAGTMMVETQYGRWIVPPDRAVWIPAGMVHNLAMIGSVTTMTIWSEPNAIADLPENCQVVDMSPLMRSLLAAAIDVEPEYELGGRDGTLMMLLLHELKSLSPLGLSLHFPKHNRLAVRCREFLKEPNPRATIESWSESLNMSRRTFTRLFRKETGQSFAQWRQQACLFAALPRLAAGEPITQIAYDLGYESPTAFATMFKRLQGVPPTQYFAAAHRSGQDLH
ncbi:MAG TPA: helix-turn-helix transcriptional regulator [Xanthobacteraceae bacterium]|jgi:AraC-like DNA-binding protein|nr:helix-turn-helix transcriptional regulator [Xanthobacteraceae bacterium]